MERPLRILVVDDSALMRQMVKRFLEEAGMEVVATARDGVEGLQKALELRPDVITLDVEMPNLNGLDMLRRLLPEAQIPVVMVSSLTQEHAPVTLEALEIGAVDFVAKPGGAISVNLGEVRDELVRKVRLAAEARVQIRRPRSSGATPKKILDRKPTRVSRPGTHASTEPEMLRPKLSRENKASLATPPRAAPATSASSFPTTDRRPLRQSDAMIVIGSSTGGPGALAELLSNLPKDFTVPIVIVQHMPAGFTASLARRLDEHSALTVREAVAGAVPQPGEAWLAPGGVHLLFSKQGQFIFDDGPTQHGVRPAVDPTLESAVSVWGRNVVAVILTGMGMDGARGARRVKQAGGRVIAQSQESCVVYGMPRAVIEMGLADHVSDLQAMPNLIQRIATNLDRK